MLILLNNFTKTNGKLDSSIRLKFSNSSDTQMVQSQGGVSNINNLFLGSQRSFNCAKPILPCQKLLNNRKKNMVTSINEKETLTNRRRYNTTTKCSFCSRIGHKINKSPTRLRLCC